MRQNHIKLSLNLTKFLKFIKNKKKNNLKDKIKIKKLP